MGFGNFIRDNKHTFGKILLNGVMNHTKFGKTIKKTYDDWSSGQYHLPTYNYCGSGTKLLGQKPKNKTDLACMQHDYEYDALQKNKHKLSKEDIREIARESDKQLLNDIQNESGLGAKVVRGAMKAKNFLEDKGIISHELFI
jgi:hypothetical protein